MRIHTLIMRPGALGDCVLTLPVLSALRAQHAAPVVLGRTEHWSFLSPACGMGCQDFSSPDWLGLFANGAPFGKTALETLAQTRRALVYLRGDCTCPRAALEAQGIPEIIISTPPVAEDSATCHAATILMNALAPLLSNEERERALKDFDGVKEILRPSEAENLAADERLAPLNGSAFFALHPGSGGRHKCWSARKFAELARALSASLKLTPLVIFGPADEQTRAQFLETLPPGFNFIEAAHWPLRHVYTALTRAKFFVGNDSGITHLAARACPTLALFGPTDPRIWAPLGESVTVVKAPKGVLENLEVDDVISECRRLGIGGAR